MRARVFVSGLLLLRVSGLYVSVRICMRYHVIVMVRLNIGGRVSDTSASES